MENIVLLRFDVIQRAGAEARVRVDKQGGVHLQVNKRGEGWCFFAKKIIYVKPVSYTHLTLPTIYSV